MSVKLDADVAIIGGGTAGCSAALHLRGRGATVALLEARLCGSQASGVNYGGVRRQGRAFVELPLASRSRAVWERLPALIGHDGEFAVSGHLKLARDEAEMAELEAWVAGARDYGVAGELFGRNAIRARYPWLGPKIIGASLVADDGHANPRLVAPHFARAARRAGADIREGTKVVGIGRDAAGFAVETNTGLSVRARTLINVAGAWGHEIAAMFGEHAPEELMTPNLCVTEPLPLAVEHNLGVVGGNVYIRQISRGNVVFGGGSGMGDSGQVRARPLPPSTAAAIARAVEAVPALRGARLIRTWSGLEGAMPDGIPVIGPSRTTPGLVHAFGFSGHGFQLGPGMGEILAELALDGRTATPIEAFSINRFAAVDAAAH
ncbi:MAG: FAD-binding oxidoreductase [Alphaproteobacteria bacterium]|nr:FAD-binding oxidoreductase [Alphaproteobacteria bacterium]